MVMRVGAGRRSRNDDNGYAMVALLVAMSVMAVMMSVALPVWTTAARREKEAELVFRGEQYARAIALFQRRNGNAIPPSLDVLVNQKFLRKKYKDPMTGEDFQLLSPGSPLPGQQDAPIPAGGSAARQARLGRVGGGGRSATPLAASVIGVVSKSTERSLRVYNGRDRYNEWVFLGTQQSTQAGRGARGGAVPGGRGGLPPGVPPVGQRGRGGRLTLPPPDGRGRLPSPGGRGGAPFPPMPGTPAPPMPGTPRER